LAVFEQNPGIFDIVFTGKLPVFSKTLEKYAKNKYSINVISTLWMCVF
jgi:hypothetical protein